MQRPIGTWHADAVPDSLLAIAREALSRADFDKGYSQPYISIVIEASNREVTTHITTVMVFGSLDAGYDNGNAYMTFDESSAKLSVDAAFVLRSDGTTQTVDHATVQSVSSDTDVFSDSVSLVVPLPGLEAHSVAVLDYTRRESLTDRVYPWGRAINLQAGYPIDRLHIELPWDAANELAWSTDAPNTMSCSKSDQGMRCEAEHIDAIPSGETIDYYDVVPQFSVAQKRTWDDLYDTTLEVVAGAPSDSASLRDTARTLHQGTATPDEFIARVHEFVPRRIRYVGIEQGEHGYRPHKTETHSAGASATAKTKPRCSSSYCVRAGHKRGRCWSAPTFVVPRNS
jgi:hypothetical protein